MVAYRRTTVKYISPFDYEILSVIDLIVEANYQISFVIRSDLKVSLLPQAMLLELKL
jgi:hypothetical protein